MFDHLSIGVADLQRSAAFYDAALAALGRVRLAANQRSICYGPTGFDGEAPFAIIATDGDKPRPDPALHIAFAASSRAEVDRFHAAALDAGGVDDGPPGIRERYDPGYYAAFVTDPDGHRIEAVLHEVAPDEQGDRPVSGADVAEALFSRDSAGVDGETSRRARMSVAVVGDGSAIGDERSAIAEELGRGIIDAGHRLVTGGLTGVMEAACRGARSSESWSDGSIVGILPGANPDAANAFVDVAIPTSLGHARNHLVAQSDAVIAVGGGAGTLSEIALAWIYDRLIIAVRCGGWSERLADQRIDERIRFSTIGDDRIHGADTSDDALNLLGEMLPRYHRARR